MKKLQYSVVLAIFVLLLGLVPSYAKSSGSSNSTGFDVKITKDRFIVGQKATTGSAEPKHENVPGDTPAAAVKLIYFAEHKDPNDTRARLAKGAPAQIGSYCLATNGELGTLGRVPTDWDAGSDTPYYYTNGIPFGCIPLDPADLEAAGLELAEVDGQTVLQPIRISLSLEDLESFPIAPATAHQERAPHTLKNYNTNFWADAGVQEFEREIAGQVVRVRATPVSYTYIYGDGEQLGPVSFSGYQLGEDVWDEPTDTSHQYAQPGDYEFRLVTGYRGEFSVDGGPWEVIDGTVERSSEPALVRVWRVRVGLVAGDCADDPTAWGCPGQ